MAELIDELMAWEKRHSLFERGHVDDFDFYSYLRRELVNTAVNSKNGVATDPFASKGQKDRGLKLFLKLLKRSERPPAGRADLLILCHPRRQKNGDVYESVFTDFLEEEFSSTLTLERLFDDHSHYEPAMTRRICYTDRITLKSYVDRLLAKRFRKKEYENVRARVAAIMEEPFRELEEEQGIDLKKKTYYERAVILYYFYHSRKKRYEAFLDKVSPKAVAEVVSKSVDAMLINELCRERSIPVIELQHSLLGPIARYPEGINEKQSPTHYLSYSDYWSEYQSYPIPADNVYACGSPYFERQVARYRKPVKKEAGCEKVIFISGMAYGRELSEAAVRLSQLAREDRERKIEIIYKLHPDEFGSWRELYPYLAESGINVVDSRDVSIYEYFNDCTAQVGVFSTAIYEGMAFDLDTYILNMSFAAEFLQLARSGYATLVEGGDDLYASLAKGSGSSKAGDICGRFWKSGARENIIARIHEIAGI